MAACDLALIRDGAVLAERNEEMPRGQDAMLPQLSQTLMDAGGFAWTELSRIAIVTGPGSFTGIRIGVAFARGLALALKIPAIGVTALEAGIPPSQSRPLLAALPAQKRPPDRTWWVQTLQNGLGTDRVTEVSTLNVDQTMIAEPKAAWAGLKAAALPPRDYPPRPVYARTPDAVPMAQNR